ncbi:hypothetical protein ATI61_10588 [Archangium gephyra]|uniref:Uncharacterized protein n=1 Tax=Archangium gephyra TaxID=48 RepID=A0AAC8QGC5_9BACT|nr:hypothetical protein [Archangium gephyra]AKJ06949.1 Hypothetical protein AA314_08575 [Archangium gephyra]REG31764.1 hypothetical protein ATI61_10588 [Archangium gephyra]
MRANLWSRILVVLCFFSFNVQASPPSQEPGTRVAIRLPESSGELPDPEKVVESLMAAGAGERQVRVIRRNTSGQQELTLDLWGDTVPQADIPQSLRDGFPVLASADIQVSTLDPKDRPTPRGEGRLERELRDEKGTVVKKVVKIIKKE